MRAVGIKILKNKLSEYVRLAAAGENVLVTDRDRVVAQLGPPPPQRAEAVSDALLAQAVREGLISPAALPPDAPPPAPPAGVMTLAELLADLDQSREDR
jgi:antitoxin (DNA-binding transcriptional repressor) of toxin-antitoxin stability system